MAGAAVPPPNRATSSDDVRLTPEQQAEARLRGRRNDVQTPDAPTRGSRHKEALRSVGRAASNVGKGIVRSKLLVFLAVATAIPTLGGSVAALVVARSAVRYGETYFAGSPRRLTEQQGPGVRGSNENALRQELREVREELRELRENPGQFVSDAGHEVGDAARKAAGKARGKNAGKTVDPNANSPQGQQSKKTKTLSVEEQDAKTILKSVSASDARLAGVIKYELDQSKADGNPKSYIKVLNALNSESSVREAIAEAIVSGDHPNVENAVERLSVRHIGQNQVAVEPATTKAMQGVRDDVSEKRRANTTKDIYARPILAAIKSTGAGLAAITNIDALSTKPLTEHQVLTALFTDPKYQNDAVTALHQGIENAYKGGTQEQQEDLENALGHVSESRGGFEDVVRGGVYAASRDAHESPVVKDAIKLQEASRDTAGVGRAG